MANSRRIGRSRSQVQSPDMAFQDRDDVILRFCGTLRRHQQRRDSVVDPAGNHDLHLIRQFGAERFHDPRMPLIRFISPRGKPTPQRETRTKLARTVTAVSSRRRLVSQVGTRTTGTPKRKVQQCPTIRGPREPAILPRM